MTRRLFITQLLALATVVSPTLGQPPSAKSEASARLVVRLPADARLFIDDAKSEQTGSLRTYETKPLEVGFKYTYSLRIELERGGKTLMLTKSVVFKPGDTTEVKFVDPMPAKVNGAKLSDDEQAVLDLVNKVRKENNLEPLRAEAKLLKAARDHSANMAAKGELNHDLDGKGPGERLAEVGYRSGGWGENCAAGQTTPQAAMESWMNSDGHRGNILNKDYLEIGIGLAKAADGTMYWTQVFARPAGQ